MAKIINPLFSFKASGSIGKSLTYRQTRAGAISHRYQRPPSTSTSAQATHRAFFGYASSLYSKLPLDLRLSYKHIYFPPFIPYSAELRSGTLPGFGNFISVLRTLDYYSLPFLPLQHFSFDRSSPNTLQFRVAHLDNSLNYYFYNLSFYHFPLADYPYHQIVHDGTGPFDDSFSYEFQPSDLPFGFTLFASLVENHACVSGFLIIS